MEKPGLAFGIEIACLRREWATLLTLPTEYDHGGHCAALESLGEFVADMRDFCGKWYNA